MNSSVSKCSLFRLSCPFAGVGILTNTGLREGRRHAKVNRMDTELFTFDGNRKYLTADEQEKFIAAANDHERAEVRTLCLTLAYTGCRISEALALTADRVDLSDKTIAFQTLKAT